MGREENIISLVIKEFYWTPEIFNNFADFTVLGVGWAVFSSLKKTV
jgi:hypothetical protein